ncbi:MAG: SDR family NAD(P)-dependent oxidoreductase, partial [Pseudomonadota bacterium]
MFSDFTERFCFEGKVALITGSTSGIGLSIAEAMASCGAIVYLNGYLPTDQVKKAIDQVKKARKKSNTLIEYIVADMQKNDQIKSMIRHIKEQQGRLDILVNNAGIQHVSAI